jgi:hypothetical protein
MSTIIVKAPVQSTKAQASKVGRRSSTLSPRTLKGQFILHASLILLFATLLTIEGATTFSRAASDLSTINNGSVFTIDAAQAMTQYIEDIDAKSADFLATAGLAYKTSCYIAGAYSGQLLSVHDCDERNIDAETVLANQELYQVTHTVVSYAGERTALQRISTGMESYLGDIHLMRADYGLATSKTDPKNPYLQQAYQAYLAAGKTLHDHVSLATVATNQIPFSTESNVPSCTINGVVLSPEQWTQGSLAQALDCLSDINHTHLTLAYNDALNYLTGATVGLSILCLLFCGLLLFATLRMVSTTHRILNPGLVAACLIGLILSFTLLGLLGNLGSIATQSSQHSNDGAFQQMVTDDYKSIYDTTLLKRYATEANADKSRWLIALEFNDQPDVQHWQTDLNNNVEQIQTLMQRAKDNQTWDEERQPLVDMHTTWGQYYSIDTDIRNATQNHSRANPLLDAEEISSWESNWAFQSYTAALDRLSNANRIHYTSTFDTTNAAVNSSFILSLALFPLAGLLALWGIAARLKDF